MAIKKPTYSGRALTQHLRDIAAEIHPDIELVTNEDGQEEPRIVTKGEKLARYLYRQALGGVEIKLNDKGEEERTVTLPQRWAVELIFDRLEGKAGQATETDDNTRSVTGRISELAEDRNNAIVDELVPPVASGPPKFKPNDAE